MGRLSPHRQTEAALPESAQRADVPLDAELDCVIAMDSDGRVLKLNSAAEQTFGYSHDEVVGQPLADLIIPPELRAAHWAGLARFLETGDGPVIGKRLETMAMRSDQSTFLVDLIITPVATGKNVIFVGHLRDMSARLESENALRASEERFRALVQGSYDIITVVDRHGQRTYASPSIEHVLGYAPADLVGRAATDLVHPDDAPVLNAAIEQCVAGANQTSPLELRFRHCNGQWHDFETIGTNLLDTPGVNGIVFNSREITGRKVAEAALRESESRFRAAFDHAPIGQAIVTAEGRFREVNRSLCEITGYAESELLGMTFQNITHPDDLNDALELSNRLFAGKISTYQMEKRYVRKDGHPIWIELTASGVQDNDGPRYAIAQIQDITGRRHLDLERATMLASERAYTKQLRELAALREELSKVVAHELRSPVAALRMMATALGTGELAPADASEMIAAIHSQIDQLDRLITDVTDAAAAERENVSVQLHSVPLTILISGAAAYARSALGDRPLSVGPVQETQVWCDPERISQVLQNLLDNIAKHTPPGTPVALRTRLHNNHARIEVADGGPGISVDDLPKIFEKFGRGREASDSQRPGLGLGLYVSRQIVEAHGAELTAESAPGGGTIFAFDLRVVR
jgi:PAS domain S-box-containing protein